MLNTITELAAAINNEPNYYADINNRFNALNRLLASSTDALGTTTTALSFDGQLRIAQVSSAQSTVLITPQHIILWAPTTAASTLTVGTTDVGATLQNLTAAQQNLTSLISTNVSNDTNLNANAGLNIGTAAGYYTDIASMRTVNINFFPPVLANGGALVYEYLRVLPAPGSATSLFRVDATPSPQITFNAPVLGNNGFIYNKSEVDNLLANIYTASLL